MGLDEDMEIASSIDNEKFSDFKDRMEAVDLFFSKSNIDQKSRLDSVNVEGIIICDSVNHWLEEQFGIRDSVRDAAVSGELTKSVSLEGKGRDEVIKLFHALDSTMQQNQLNEVLKRLGGGV